MHFRRRESSGERLASRYNWNVSEHRRRRHLRCTFVILVRREEGGAAFLPIAKPYRRVVESSKLDDQSLSSKIGLIIGVHFSMNTGVSPYSFPLIVYRNHRILNATGETMRSMRYGDFRAAH